LNGRRDEKGRLNGVLGSLLTSLDRHPSNGSWKH
jgi:hypothetical protein